jgi:aryl-alcohol dehydrogenase-like predicted oxidoreductase
MLRAVINFQLILRFFNRKLSFMKYRVLGKSGLEISEVGFGCMSLKGSFEENSALINSAVERGINFFDTADLYDKGENEKLVGRILKDKRDKVIIATKVGNRWREDGSGWDWAPNKKYILSSVEKSLERLQMDHIDLYVLHGGTMEDPIDEIIEAFEILVEQGKIRHYGISSIRPVVIREYIRRSNITSVMMQYGLLDRRPAESALNLLEESNIGVLARGSLAKGLLVDKPASPFLNYNEKEVGLAASAVQSVSGRQRSADQSAIRYVLQHPAITSAVVGIRTMEQLAGAAGTSDSPLLTEAELQLLEESIPVNYYDQHR